MLRSQSDIASSQRTSGSAQRPNSVVFPPPYNAHPIPHNTGYASPEVNNNNSNRGNRESRIVFNNDPATNRLSMLSMGSYSSVPIISPGINPTAQQGGNFSGFPSDDEILFHIRRILSTANLMTVTKKNVREELSGLFGCDLNGKKAFINSCIDDILRGGDRQ